MRAGQLFARTVTLKIKFFDFRSITRSRSFSGYFNDDATITETALDLLKKTEAGKIPVRLIGVTVSGFYGERNTGGTLYQPEFDFMKNLPLTLNREW